MSQTHAQLRLDLATALADFLPPREAHAESSRWFEEGLGLSRSWMAAHGDEPVASDVRRRVSQWLRRRRTGEPWAYILGWTLFRGHRFDVDRNTLIPRPETEIVLEAALETGKRLGIRRACDIGTGAGILGICLALETNWEIQASDISGKALEMAHRNAIRHEVSIQFFEGHLLNPLTDPLGMVVSNPPYVDPADRPSLQRELAFEPESALFAADRGLQLSTEILRESLCRLAPACVLEIGAGQGQELLQRALGFGWKRAFVHKDLADHDRVLVALR